MWKQWTNGHLLGAFLDKIDVLETKTRRVDTYANEWGANSTLNDQALDSIQISYPMVFYLPERYRIIHSAQTQQPEITNLFASLYTFL